MGSIEGGSWGAHETRPLIVHQPTGGRYIDLRAVARQSQSTLWVFAGQIFASSNEVTVNSSYCWEYATIYLNLCCPNYCNLPFNWSQLQPGQHGRMRIGRQPGCNIGAT